MDIANRGCALLGGGHATKLRDERCGLGNDVKAGDPVGAFKSHAQQVGGGGALILS